MSDHKKIVFAIIKFLKDELSTLSPESCESVEVAVQCLENAYEINSDDATLDVGVPLTEIFESHLETLKPTKIPTPAEKEEAERSKTEGNNFVKAEKFLEAIQCYTEAIRLNPHNPLYYCNRAAAYSRLNNHQATIEDCKAALKIDPTYSKAYGRLGFAYSNLKMYQEAKESYRKALELDPGNQNYINNLELNEGLSKRSEQSVNGAPRGLNIQDSYLSALLQNPSLMNIASNMMSDPEMQNMLSVMSENLEGNGSDMEALLQVGQRVAQHIQNTNPGLLDQLRQGLSSVSDNSPNPQAKKN